MSVQRLWLSPALAQQVRDHALHVAPHEACGLLGGSSDGTVMRVVPTPNVAADPHTRYTIEPRAFVDALQQFQRDGLALVGIYHSHPNGAPLPSPTDVREAAYPDVAYLVVGREGAHTHLAAWRIHYGAVERLPLVESDRPPPPLAPTGDRALAVVMLLTLLLSMVVLVGASLALLPPAPLLP